MSYMSTKFCALCDADYDWAAPECPGCVARRAYEDLQAKFNALRACLAECARLVERACNEGTRRAQRTDDEDGIKTFAAIREELPSP